MISIIQARLARARNKARSQEPSKKPVGLIYGRDDIPPLATTLLLGLQHAAESASKVALATGVLVAIGAPAEAIETMIAATLICSGLCCILIAQKAKPFGYGYLAPAAIMSSFVAPSLVAARTGGLPLMAGMTLVTGTCVIVLSRVLHRWRFLFPPEVVGLIAFMVGASQATLAVSRFVGLGDRMDQTPDPNYLFVAALTLGLLASLTVWGKGWLRLFSSMITVIFGYVAAAKFGFIGAQQWALVEQAAL